MSLSDPIADMLTRIRNGVRNRAKSVEIRNSKVCRGIADVLRDEGYIDSYDVRGEQLGGQGVIDVKLKYGPRGEQLIHSLKRESKPGRRVYSNVRDMPRPLQGLGISIVSTSSGVLSDRMAREKGVGGELLCTIE
ncbi:MAG: 30S ribosomal protein S8 [Planctomycetota bacterium]